MKKNLLKIIYFLLFLLVDIFLFNIFCELIISISTLYLFYFYVNNIHKKYLLNFFLTLLWIFSLYIFVNNPGIFLIYNIGVQLFYLFSNKYFTNSFLRDYILWIVSYLFIFSKLSLSFKLSINLFILIIIYFPICNFLLKNKNH